MKPLMWSLVACTFGLIGCSEGQEPTAMQGSASSAEVAKSDFSEPEKEIQNGFNSPEMVFEAYTQAVQKSDWRQFYDYYTPALQDAEVFELQFQLSAFDSEIAKRHQDPARALELEKLTVNGRTEEQIRALLIGTLKDKQAFFAEGAAEFGEHYRSAGRQGPLRELKITGGRARAIVSSYHRSCQNDGPMIAYPHDEPIYFSCIDGRWLIDFPTQDELQIDNGLIFDLSSRKVEAYHHCPQCNTLQGGMYKDTPFKEFSGEGRQQCSHDWKEIRLQQFKDLAARLHGYRWNDETDEFWNR